MTEPGSLTTDVTTQTAVTLTDQAPQTEAPLNGPWFVVSCLLLPVIWGVIVHQIFKRLRGQRPDKAGDTGWPDYQI